jgi:3-deoxy-D-manno-octulosonate 8-phosphate phosphatase KdsC-like HAD superfamily phosphatase
MAIYAEYTMVDLPAMKLALIPVRPAGASEELKQALKFQLTKTGGQNASSEPRALPLLAMGAEGGLR